MQISKLTSAVTKVSRKIGETILNDNVSNKAGKLLSKTNKFLQGESYNPGRGAYYLLMGGFVIAPRLIKAREPDEFREILTRDTTTVLTILFAMKALQSGMCTAAQKTAGITLVKDTVGKSANKLKRLGGYFNPEGGIIPLSSEEIIAKYSRFSDKESFVKALETLDAEGGSVSKMFNIETKNGIFGKIKGMFSSKKNETPLLNAAKKMFGDDFASKSNEELIKAVKNIDGGEALEGLADVIGSKAAGYNDQVIKGVLTDKSNPVTNYARGIAAKFNTLSLGITAGFLGFGLSKFNELFTAKQHLNKPGTNTKTRASETESVILNTPIHNMLQNNKAGAFNNFKGFVK